VTDDPTIHDLSRVDAYAASRRRIAVFNASWKPALAGAAASLAVSAAIWVVLPKFSTREVVVDHVVQKDVTVDHITPHDVVINNVIPRDVVVDIPRIVTPSPLARTPAEQSFTSTEDWRAADVRGRILREDRNGFILATDEGEKPFYPAKIGVGGKVEFDPSLKDVVTPFLGSLAFCRPTPIGVYQCTALAHDGREVAIPEVPIGAPL
jgi:hypothetical protein